MPRISLIVAMAQNQVIGRGGSLPWRLSADLKRFKTLTMGHSLAMGRKTFESIGRALPGRTSIVITRQADYCARPGVLVAPSLNSAIELAADDTELFVIGGGEIYRLAVPLAERMYVTLVDAEVAGDTFFPEVNLTEWRLVEQSHHAADEKNEYPHRFCIYERPRPTK